MKNTRIRMKLMEHNVKIWELAKLLGVSEMTIYRRLREELPEEEQNRICKLIESKGGVIHEK